MRKQNHICALIIPDFCPSLIQLQLCFGGSLIMACCVQVLFAADTQTVSEGKGGADSSREGDHMAQKKQG